jgi:hypothetical protein
MHRHFGLTLGLGKLAPRQQGPGQPQMPRRRLRVVGQRAAEQPLGGLEQGHPELTLAFLEQVRQKRGRLRR